MGRLDLIFESRKSKRVQIDSIVLDATLSEVHSGAAQVTEHPVEGGVDISDHVIQRPDELDITGVVSNTPIEILERIGNILAGAESGIAGAASAAFNPQRAEDAYKSIRLLKEAGALITIVTPLRTYERMAITSLVVNRDSPTGDAVALSMRTKTVRLVESLTVEVDPAILRAKPKKNRGRQPPAKADTVTSAKAEEQDTLLKQGVNWVGRKLGR